MRELINFRKMPNTADTEEAIAEEMFSLVAYQKHSCDLKRQDARILNVTAEIDDWIKSVSTLHFTNFKQIKDRLGYGQFEVEWKLRVGDNPQNPTKGQVERYYREGLGTIFETMNNHTNRTQLCLMRYIVELLKELKIEKVFDLGGGCGALSLILDACGFEAWYADTPRSYTEAFACSRFSRRNSHVNFLGDKWKEKWSGDIICLEVIEHLWDPIAFLVQVTSKMKVGCYFVSSESCSDICPPIHLNGNWPFAGKAYIAIMENLGFEYLGGECMIPERPMGLECFMFENVLRVFKKVEEIPEPVVEWYDN